MVLFGAALSTQTSTTIAYPWISLLLAANSTPPFAALLRTHLILTNGALLAHRTTSQAGRGIDKGLHFLSNYSRGQRWGSGGVNFLFDETGRVSVIFAII